MFYLIQTSCDQKSETWFFFFYIERKIYQNARKPTFKRIGVMEQLYFWNCFILLYLSEAIDNRVGCAILKLRFQRLFQLLNVSVWSRAPFGLLGADSSSTSIYSVPEKPYCAPRLKDLLQGWIKIDPNIFMKNVLALGPRHRSEKERSVCQLKTDHGPKQRRFLFSFLPNNCLNMICCL